MNVQSSNIVSVRITNRYWSKGTKICYLKKQN